MPNETKRKKKLCNFIFHIIEPVGLKAPAFSGDAYSQSFIRAVNQSFGLLCQAQAFPVPIIRFVIENVEV